MGRVLEFVHERLEQKNDEQMSKDMRSGGSLVRSRRPFQANQAFQPLEAEFNTPSQPIEGKNIVRRKVLWLERGHQDHPICRIECLSGELMTSFLRGPARLAPRIRGSLRRLSHRYQTHRQRRTRLAFDPDWPIDHAAGRGLAQFGRKINQITFGIEPTRTLPAGSDHEVRTGLAQTPHAVGLQIGAVGELASAALMMAIRQQRPQAGLIDRSDRGVQYASNAYRNALAGAGITAEPQGRFATTTPRWRASSIP